MVKTADTLIVGAGMAGLFAARALAAAGVDYLVVDKGRSAGGRMATRRIGPGRADHGAQFFTVRSAVFQAIVDEWLAHELVYQWSTGWSSGSLMLAPNDGHPRYAAMSGMNALAKHVAAPLHVTANTRLTSLRPQGDGWLAESEAGDQYRARAAILTPPVPQSLALLEAGRVELSDDDFRALTAIDYAPSLTALYWVDGRINLPMPGALQRPDADIAWIADNQRKGISPDAALLTAQANLAFSRAHFDDDDDRILRRMTRDVRQFIGRGARLREVQLKRWRYAQPTVIHPDATLLARDLPPLVFAGDAFGGPRVEGAVLSGMAAAAALIGHNTSASNPVQTDSGENQWEK